MHVDQADLELSRDSSIFLWTQSDGTNNLELPSLWRVGFETGFSSVA